MSKNELGVILRGLCQCGCGQSTSIIRKSNRTLGLVRGDYRRYRVGHNKLHHGGARKGRRTAEFCIWSSMRQRCEDPGLVSYKNYGGRGITVCDRWQKFENFIADMGPKPGPGYMIERVDNNKGYSPDNCVWIGSMREQQRNKRTVKLNTEAVKVIRCMLAKGVRQILLARLHKVTPESISKINCGLNWK